MAWIRIEDRLPDRYGLYIVALEGRSVATNVWEPKNEFKQESGWCYKGWKHITHWMPLPEPPTD